MSSLFRKGSESAQYIVASNVDPHMVLPISSSDISIVFTSQKRWIPFSINDRSGDLCLVVAGTIVINLQPSLMEVAVGKRLIQVIEEGVLTSVS